MKFYLKKYIKKELYGVGAMQLPTSALKKDTVCLPNIEFWVAFNSHSNLNSANCALCECGQYFVF